MKEKRTILVIEDEKINRIILQKMLSDQFELIEAENGAVGWEILTDPHKEIAAVLLDLVMPVMNGYEFLAKIKEIPYLTEVPIIVMTGESDEGTEQKVLEAGAWDFVNKPYNPKVLLSRLRNAIARRQMSVFEKMQQAFTHDALTGLYNRGKMFERTKAMLSAHPEDQFAFFRIDIDNFALYNSAFGEKEGDKLLCLLAKLLEHALKDHEPCVYGRVNADVFCSCMRYGGDVKQLEAIIEQTQLKLAEYRDDYMLMISVGVYVIKESDLSVEEMYIRASMGASKCKRQYGKHLGFYDEAEGKRAAEEIAITNDMRTALAEEQFVVYLQPKFNLSQETACGAEALVRWQHPQRGLVSPGLFIPVFERNGFIAQLDYYMWEHTCILLKKWIDAGRAPFPVSVNVSRISLYNPNLVGLLEDLVKKYNINPVYLQLEVTESAYMTSPQLMQDTIHDLHEANFTILMDDFGSSYSSLNTLKDIDVDVLKIDMKFLPINSQVEKGEIILSSVIKMANWLGMSVIVEGVETRQQRDFLEGAGCNCVQGFYYSRPIPSQEYEEKYVYAEQHMPVGQDLDPFSEEIIPAHNVTILVIDDDDMDLAIIREYFQRSFWVQSCATAEEALLYLKHHSRQVRLILVDNVMPGMSGLDFLTYCRDDAALSTIPKIMITANDSVKDQVEAFQQGAYDYITKPLVKEIVIARVEHVMDISRQYRAFENWEYDYRSLAERDQATGLFNKTAFLEMGDRILLHQPDDGKALLIFDFDDFKMVNDQYGHLVGDKVIKCVADVLKREFRKTDLVGRFGGDEFMVLMVNLPNHEMARKKAMEIIKQITISCAKELYVNAGMSIGVGFTEDGDTMESLFGRADEALYEAKKTGKGKVIVYGEKVPPIQDDNKPVILVCGEDPQLYPALALAYGETAAFGNITSCEELDAAFKKYQSRIRAICLDTQKRVVADADVFLGKIIEEGGGTKIPILAVCKEGDMEMLKAAVELPITDVLTLPAQMDVIQRQIARAMITCHDQT